MKKKAKLLSLSGVILMVHWVLNLCELFKLSTFQFFFLHIRKFNPIYNILENFLKDEVVQKLSLEKPFPSNTT